MNVTATPDRPFTVEGLKASARAAALAAGLPGLEETRVNGIRTFMDPETDVSYRLEEAHALLTVMANAYRVCDDVKAEDADPLLCMRSGILARALEGVATLLALGQYHVDVVDAKRQER